MIDNQIVGRNITMLRRRMKLTQQHLAGLVNVTHQAVSKWERGVTLPDVQTMLNLGHLFGVSMEQLLTGPIEVAG